jgi:hypothetical protein
VGCAAPLRTRAAMGDAFVASCKNGEAGVVRQALASEWLRVTKGGGGDS